MALEYLCPGMLLWYSSSNLRMKKYVARKIKFYYFIKKGFTNEICWNLGLEMAQFVYVLGVGQASSVWVRQSIRCTACDFGDHKGSFPRCR